ncbi:MAG: DUF6498-containing protein [Bacteroidota bacterium]
MRIILKDYSVLLLIVVNLFPIIGALLLGWDIFEIVILYVLETFIIGLLNIFKMFFTKGVEKFFMVPFFLIHYNLFILGQSIFVIILLGGGINNNKFFESGSLDYLFSIIGNRDFIIAVFLIIFSHGFSFIKNFIRKKEYVKMDAIKLMFAPYQRIFLQQIMVIGGAFIILLFNTHVGILIIMIILKTMLDLRAHYKSHNPD